MKLYLIRHGQAVQAGPSMPDGSRHLTLDGRQITRRVTSVMRGEGVELTAVLCSPLVRAMQTAELLAAGLDYFGTIESFSGLVPGCEPNVAAGELMSREGSIAVVSHEPTVSSLAAYLLGVPSFRPFRPSQVCLIEDGKPVWRLDPRSFQLSAQFA